METDLQDEKRLTFKTEYDIMDSVKVKLCHEICHIQYKQRLHECGKEIYFFAISCKRFLIRCVYGAWEYDKAGIP